jgi:hypothetical protein
MRHEEHSASAAKVAAKLRTLRRTQTQSRRVFAFRATPRFWSLASLLFAICDLSSRSAFSVVNPARAN